MEILGIHLLKNELRFSSLTGSRSSPILKAKGRILTTNPNDAPVLMDWYDSQFRQLITNHRPDSISYRLTLSPKKEQLFTSSLPLGLLNLLAHQLQIPINFYTPPQFSAARLGLPKGTDIYAACDTAFGTHPPHWDKNQKNSILCAWFDLPK